MPDFPIVDAHVHLCDPQRLSYGWMKNAPSLDRLVLPEHLTKAAAPFEIDRFVFVEVDVDNPQHLAEADWVKPDNPSATAPTHKNLLIPFIALLLLLRVEAMLGPVP